MKLIVFLLSLAIHGYFSEKVRYDGYKLYKITPRTHEGVKALNELEAAGLSGYNFWSTVGHVGDPVELMVPPYKISEVQQLATKLGLDYDVLMENVQDYIDAEQSPQTFDDGDEGEFGWDRYHTLDEVCLLH